MSIEFAYGLDLPDDAVTQTIAFIGRKGSGKTHSAGKLVEGMAGIGAQVVVVDPIGVHWGYRLSASGKGKGIDIPIFGGGHGDLPLSDTSGSIIADFAVNERRSMVLDISQFRKAPRCRFVTAFAEQLFHIKKTSRTPIHIVLEEAHMFIPQNKMRGEEGMVGAWEDIIRLGRNYGIGVTMISQRPQSINKEVLNQTECLVLHQLVGSHERKAIKEWVVSKGEDTSKIADDLPSLETGEAFLWSPGWLREFKKIRVKKKKTYDSSSTPTADGDYSAETRPLAAIEIKNLTSAMESVAAEAVENDPKRLKAENARLKKTIEELKNAKPVVDETQIKEAVAKVLDAARHELERSSLALFDRIRTELDSCEKSMVKTLGGQEFGKKLVAGIPIANIPIQRVPVAARSVQPKGSSPSYLDNKPSKKAAEFAGSPLPKGQAKILAATIQNGTVSREQLTVLTGYKKSSRDAYILRLKNRGMLEDSGSELVATQEGIDAMPNVEPLPTGAELREHWLGTLPVGEAAVLSLVIEAYPEAVDRDEITEKTGYKKSSRDAYILRLKAKKLLVASGSDVVASDHLF
jgi:hypothetical protein